MDRRELSALGRVIKRHRIAAKLSQTRFAELVGYEGQSTISRIERGDQEVSQDGLQRIAELFGTKVSKLWLEAEQDGGPEEATATVALSYRISEDAGQWLAKLAAKPRAVPLISWVQAGLPQHALDPHAPGAATEAVISTAKVGKNAYALRVRGDSMTNPRGQPSFPEGSVLIVDPSREPVNGSLVIVRFDGVEEATFKKLVEDAGRRFLVPLNPQFPTIEINDGARFCGTVVSTAEAHIGE